ncbi:MAG: hypothetical protein NVSMB14_00170 [Isosphaeraceae bacterium]
MSISLEAIHRIDSLCDRFEKQFRAGSQPKIEEFLGLVSIDVRPALFKELLGLELEMSDRMVDQVLMDEYRRRFPDHDEAVYEVFQKETEAEPNERIGSRETELESHSSRDDGLAEAVEHRFDPSSNGAERSARNAGNPKIGRYLLIERMGFGSQGDVWRAVQVEPIVRTVALKLLPIGTELDEERVDRLRKEAERAARVGHASIPAIFEFGTANGRTFMAMQLIDGFSLAAVIRQRRGRLQGKPPADLHRLAVANEPDYLQSVVGLFSWVARALGKVHGARLAHRDIKPANLLLERSCEERIFLADFGLARDLDDLSTRAESLSGTLVYMAPEKLLGVKGANEVLADIYSVGVSLFETLVLERPFNVPEELTASAKALFIATTEPKNPRDFQPSLSRDLDAVVMKAMERDPSRRYATANEFADDLDRWRNGEPVLARPPSIWRKAGREAVRRRYELMSAGVVLTIACAVFSAVAIIKIAESRRLEERRVKAERLQRNAEVLLNLDELEAAYNDWDRAKQLEPNNSRLRFLGATITTRLLEKSLNSNEMDDAVKTIHLYNLWKDAQGGNVARRRYMALFYGIGDMPVASEPPGAHVTFRAMSRDGRPKNLVLKEIVAGSRADPAILHEFIPGYYWVTAYGVDGGFSERTFRFGDLSSPNGRATTLTMTTRKRASLRAGMVRVEGGLLRMGVDRDPYKFVGQPVDLTSSPVHPVQVQSFDLDQTEVSRSRFREWYDRTEAINPTHKAAWRTLLKFDEILRPEFDDWPMTGLPYRLAVEFAAEEGLRLPAEEELEWAARGSTGRLLPEGLPKEWTPENHDDWNTIHPVRSVPLDRVEIPGGSSIFGLFGNASEMTLFRWRLYPYPNGIVPVRWGVVPGIAVRSGIIMNYSEGRPFQLGFVNRTILPGDEVHPLVGFRCARSLQPLFEDTPVVSRGEFQ